jgi:hypothetical protein
MTDNSTARDDSGMGERDNKIAWICRDANFARAVANSDSVMAVYAAPEFDELSEDGQAWIEAIVNEAISRLSHRSDGEHVARVVEVTKPDIVAGDDGYFVFWPTSNKGALTARDLRIIADELDRGNSIMKEKQ